MALIKSSPGQKWPGFSFALHLLRVQGFCFALLQYSPIQAFTARFVLAMRVIPSTPQNSARGFTVTLPAICPIQPPMSQTDTSGYNTACATLERITTPQHLQRIPDTNAAPDALQASTAALL